MTKRITIRTAIKAALVLLCGVVCLGMAASAQVASYGDKQTGDQYGNELPQVLKKVGISQHLNQQLPLDAQFRDETGKPVKLGDYFGKHPVILSLVYYQLPDLCSEDLNGLVWPALEMVPDPGQRLPDCHHQYRSQRNAGIAAAKKAFYVKRYGRPETANGWHFLTGAASGDQCRLRMRRLWLCARARAGWQALAVCPRQLHRDCDSAGPSGAVLPGRGVCIAGSSCWVWLKRQHNTIGRRSTNILTYCYHYDPQTNRHSFDYCARGAGGRHDDRGWAARLHVCNVPAGHQAGPRTPQRNGHQRNGLQENGRQENGQGLTMDHISPVLWQFLVKWLTNSALFPREASAIAPAADALYFFPASSSRHHRHGAGVHSGHGVLTPCTAREVHPVAVQIEGSTLLEATWTIIPLGIFLFCFVWGALLYFRIYNPPTNAMNIYIVGKQWMWKAEHPGGQHEIDSLHVSHQSQCAVDHDLAGRLP
jgi:hypothetical protein